MDLKHVKGIGPAKETKLASAGIHSVSDLARADIDTVADKTGLTHEQLRDLKGRAAALSIVEDLKGLSPSSLETIAQASIQGLQELARTSQAKVADGLNLAAEKAQATQAQAVDALQRLAAEAKTPEGRRAIVAEAKAAAQEGAAKVQAAAAKLTEKAKQLQADAPVQLKEVQARAQKVVADAEARLKELVQLAESTTTAEIERVKAANARLVARFQKAA